VSVLHIAGAVLIGLGILGIGRDLTVPPEGWSPGPLAFIPLALGTVHFIFTWPKGGAKGDG
jgi:hypothetical protein